MSPSPLSLELQRDPRLDRIAVGVVASVTLLHVLYAGLVALAPQEAYYWEWSRHLDLSYYDHPPLVAWTIHVATAILGESERAIRAAGALHSAVFATFLWLSARRLFGSRAALAAVSAAATVPLFSLGQVVVTPDAPLLAGWAMAMYFTVRALDDDEPRWLLGAGFATGWAVLGKYTGFLLFPQILGALLLDPRGRRQLRGGWPWAGAALALVLLAPVAVWNAEHDWASFAFQTAGRARAASFRPVLVARFLGLQALLVSPLLLLLLVEAAVTSFRRRHAPAFRLCAVFSLPLLAVAAAASPFVWVKGNWVAPAYAAALLAAAALALERGRRAARVAGAVIAVALATTTYLHLVPVLPWLPFPARDAGSAAWRELAARVEAERRRLPADAFVAGCNYKVSAELAYYLPDRVHTLSGEVAGDDGLQYRYWFHPAEIAGHQGIVVLDTRERGTCRHLAEACGALVPLDPLTVRRGAAPVTTFRLWRCTYARPPAVLTHLDGSEPAAAHPRGDGGPG
ncbi:MAG TPA: glycosyltransferase family 39 protein [Anaeromyxobacter sp.]|nr:glycosyltransferase family 39 protein [Anaeromyxobacter sp.]